MKIEFLPMPSNQLNVLIDGHTIGYKHPSKSAPIAAIRELSPAERKALKAAIEEDGGQLPYIAEPPPMTEQEAAELTKEEA